MLAGLLMLPAACTSSNDPVGLEMVVPQSLQLARLQQSSYRTPEECLSTLERAIESKSSAGATAYLLAFSAPDSKIGSRTFQAVYDNAVRRAWESAHAEFAPDPWGIVLERGVPTELFRIRPSDTYHFQWLADPSAPNDDTVADTVLFHRRYQLIARPRRDVSGASDEVIAIGACDLSFERARGRWSIFRWVDHAGPQVGPTPPNQDEGSFTWWRLQSLVGDP
jgi:hypothetical protein